MIVSDMLQKCGVCRGLIDEEDLFCSNCGTEAPHHARNRAPSTASVKHNFTCQGCGASMSYDASAGTLRCPFCGSEQLEEQQPTKVLRPQRVVPFARDQAFAIRKMRESLGRRFWRPSGLAEAAVVTKMSPVYVPYWVFQTNTHTYWTADSDRTPAGARGDWMPVSGEHRGRYSGLLVGASGVLTHKETTAICPFDLSKSVVPDQIDLENATCEQFRVQRKYARPLARAGIEERERRACSDYVPGKCRNVHVNVKLLEMSSEPVLLPVWIMAYRFKDNMYRFLVNGQNGRCTGSSPISLLKLAIAIGLGLLGLLLVALVVSSALSH